MAEPNKKALGETEVHVTLDGRVWPIPKMALRQCSKLQPLFATGVVARMADPQTRMLEITGDEFDTLQEIVFVGLTRAHPDLTREEFNEFEGGAQSLIAAAFAVLSQSDLFSTPKEPTKGEGEGA